MYSEYLEIIANWAAILTAAVATIAYVRYAWAQRSRRCALEAYLREERLQDADEGRRTIMHLMAHLAMTEAEVLHAGFQSKLIVAAPGGDGEGRAARLYFQYVGSDLPRRRTL